ncbi:glycosyltransferase [Lacticaseibacillus zhaodongensis]|uniref:glycosyltransferase n=1 Tax=Lacticaseibacillus zhaodongensis TaxID=2668065 RepID=UPI0012D2D5F6|nr:glycosyltransferase [Lacticaseibacillus zhaodongensis]
MRRILHIQGRMGLGGAESFMMNVYGHADLTKVQFDFLVYDTYKNVDVYNEKIQQMGGRIFISPNPNESLIAYMVFLYKLLKAEHFYGVENEVYFGGGINLLVAWIAKIPKRVAISHATSDGKGSSLRHRLLSNVLMNMLNLFSTDRFAVSQEAGLSLFGRNNFIEVKNGIDFGKFRNASMNQAGLRIRKSLKISRGTLVAINIGRLEKQKNQKYLADVMHSMSAEHQQQLVLIIVGEGSEKEELKEYFDRLGLEQHVRFLGSRNDIPELLSAADVFVLPSLYEGLPTVLVEAQVAGLPVVMSDQVSSEAVLSNQASRLPIRSKDLSRWEKEIFAKRGAFVRDPKLNEYDSEHSSKTLLSVYEE